MRLSYTDQDASATVSLALIEESNYYEFGMKHQGYNTSVSSLGNSRAQMFKYNHKELQDEFGLNLYDYGARFYDPSIGRWGGIDPLAEKMRRHSPYNYCFDNPIIFIDPDGMSPATDFYNDQGNKIGTDGNDDKRKAVVTDKKEAKAIAKTNKNGGTTALENVSSAVVLPSDAALGEAVNVLDKTTANGGLKEESSMVYNDGTVGKGPTGSEPTIDANGLSTATTTLPNLSEGCTTTDVEVSIHSHPTEVQVVNGVAYPHSANSPSSTDQTTFTQFNTNIIVGPLGVITNVSRNPNGTLNIPSRPNGAVIYGNSHKPLSLTKQTIQKIIK